MPSKTAVIVGASRGLGLQLAREYLRREWQVIATVRGGRRTGLDELASDRLEVETLDITEPDQIAALHERLSGRRIDLLFVNASVANDPDETIGAVATEAFIRVMVTNALSPMRVVEALAGLVPDDGLIAAMSSGLGSVAGNEAGGWEVYRGSKAALNTLMRSFAARPANARRTMVLVAPGWVRTDMGGPNATLDAETSITGVADTLAAQFGRPGLRYLDYQGETVRW